MLVCWLVLAGLRALFRILDRLRNQQNWFKKVFQQGYLNICIFTCLQQEEEGFSVCWLWRTGRPEGFLWTALCCGTLGVGVSVGRGCGSRSVVGKVTRAPWSCWCGRSWGPGHHPPRQVGRSGPGPGVPLIPGAWPQFCNTEKLLLTLL